jgi:hypothetical protein
MSASTSARIAAILSWVNAFGFGLPSLLAIGNLLAGRGVPTIMGFPAHGAGPLERLGVHTSIPRVAAFLLVCMLEGLAGFRLWGGHRTGAVLALTLLPTGAVFWWRFALPLPPLFALARTVLILPSWPSLKQPPPPGHRAPGASSYQPRSRECMSWMSFHTERGDSSMRGRKVSKV